MANESTDTATVLAYAYLELNTIRARDGAPQGVDEGYFSALIDAISRVLIRDTGHDGHCHPLLYTGQVMEDIAR